MYLNQKKNNKKIEIDNAKVITDIDFVRYSFASKILNEFLKKPEFTNYTKLVFKDTIWHLT
jgi:hypothetical protein